MPIPLPYNFQNLDTSGLQDARDSAGEVIGKATPASYLDSNFSQLANIVTVSSTAPTPSYAGQLWLDTSTSPPLIKQWDGFAWQSRVSIADNSDKVDNFHASQTPSANTIVPLNADGILDLSGTYVKSNVYTFRRVDLTGATSDYELQVGEEAIIRFTGATSVPLRIATSDDRLYEIFLQFSVNLELPSTNVYLNPNNTTYASSFGHVSWWWESNGSHGWVAYTNSAPAFRLYTQTPHSYIILDTTRRFLRGFVSYEFGDHRVGHGVFASKWHSNLVSWTSLGTFTFPTAMSGYILVRRLI
jgi:hypothetical protein